MTKEKEILEKLLEEITGQYFRFKSAYHFYKDNNEELLLSGVDSKREELSKLKTEPVKADGLDQEQIKEATYKNAVKISELSSEIDHYELVIREMDKLRNNINETVFHYNYIKGLNDDKNYKVEKFK